MSESPARNYDRLLFRSLRTGIEAGLVVLIVHAGRLNRSGSPVWDPWENVIPILVMLLLSTVLLFIFNQIIGLSMILLTAVLYVVLFRPWILHRVSMRAKSAAMDNAHNWDVLWRAGGLSVIFNGVQPTRCASPSGDWRLFVTQHLPHAEGTMESGGIGQETELEKQTHQLPASLELDSEIPAPQPE